MEVELCDEQDDDLNAAVAVREWQCPGCRMHVHGRPCAHDAGVSGLPLWLAEQFWGTHVVHDDHAGREYLFDVARETLAEAAADEVPVDETERHAMGLLVRVVLRLRARIVPSHPLLSRLIDAVEAHGADGLKEVWSPFVEKPREGRIDVTFRIVGPSNAGMFAFEYHSLAERLYLHTCYTVWRRPP